MAALSLDFGALLQDIPQGAWVAISQDHKRVVAFGADMQQVLSEARDKGEDRPLMVRVPDQQSSLLL